MPVVVPAPAVEVLALAHALGVDSDVGRQRVVATLDVAAAAGVEDAEKGMRAAGSSVAA